MGSNEETRYIQSASVTVVAGALIFIKEEIPILLKLDYFYGDEAEQYSFYRIPKTLFTDARYKAVPVEAKVLYGLLLDRMGLSARNGWMDENNRVYIYFTVEDAVAQMGCGKDKAVKLFKALDSDTGIGLIERRKQGQGRPARIYVKNFILPSEPDAGPEPGPSAPETGSSEPEPHNSEETFPSEESPTYEAEVQTSENQKSESVKNEKSVDKSARPRKSEVKTSEKPKSGRRKIRSQDFGKSASNNTEKNNTEKNDTENQSIHPSPSTGERINKPKLDKGIMDSYRGLIKQNIEYYGLLEKEPCDKDILDGYVELMVDVCCGQSECVRINGENMPREVVKSRFLKLNRGHISYVRESMRNNTTKIGNIKAYTLTALYNSFATIDQ